MEKSKAGGATRRPAKRSSARKSVATGRKSAASGGSIVSSLVKGLRILEYVTSSPGTVRLRSVAAHFKMDRSAAYRFLATLGQFEYVIKDTETKAYSPGPGLARLSRLARSRSEVIETIQPFLKRLSELTGQTGYLAMLDDNRALLLEVAPGDNVVSVRHYVGQLEPLYCTAVGKALLAALPSSEREAIIAQLELRKHTPQTIASKKLLRAEIAQVRAQGIAFDECEWREEICCIGAPILDEAGYPVAAVGLSMVGALVKGGPRARADWIASVREAAFGASKMLTTMRTFGGRASAVRRAP